MSEGLPLAFQVALSLYAIGATAMAVGFCFLWNLELKGKTEAVLSVPFSFMFLYIGFIFCVGFSSFVLWIG